MKAKQQKVQSKIDEFPKKTAQKKLLKNSQPRKLLAQFFQIMYLVKNSSA